MERNMSRRGRRERPQHPDREVLPEISRRSSRRRARRPATGTAPVVYPRGETRKPFPDHFGSSALTRPDHRAGRVGDAAWARTRRSCR